MNTKLGRLNYSLIALLMLVALIASLLATFLPAPSSTDASGELWLTDYSNRAQIDIVENGGGNVSNWAEQLEVFYNSPPMSTDAQCQFLYRPAVRYVGSHDHTYIATVNSSGSIIIHQWDETDSTFSTPVELWDFDTTSDDHNGTGIIVLQHQTGDYATHNGKILVVGVEFSVGLYSKRSDITEDATNGWGNSITIDTGEGLSYTQLTETDDGIIWCLYAKTVGSKTVTYITTLKLASDADNDTWSTPFLFSEYADNVVYHKLWLDDNDTDIHVGLNRRPGAGYIQQDLYYVKKTNSITGIANDDITNKLVDTTADFVTDGIVADWYIINTTDNTHGRVGGTDNLTALSITDFSGANLDLFPNGDESYMIYNWLTTDNTLKHIPLDWSVADHAPETVFTTNSSPQHYTYIWDVKTDSSNYPHILFFNTANSGQGASTDIHRASYNGTGWTIEDTGINGQRMGTDPTFGHNTGAEFDEGNPDIIFASVRKSNQVSQIEAFERVSGTWYIANGSNGTTAINEDGLITQSAPGLNFRPIHVLNGGGRFEWLWFFTYQYEQDMTVQSLRFAYPGFSNGKYIGLYKNARTDFGDLRFTEDDGGTLLGDAGQPWIQEKTDSWRAIIWMNMGNVTASETLTTYLYYSNNSSTNDADQDVMDAVFMAGGASTGDTTCDHFDGTIFDPLDSDRWTITNSPYLNGASAAIFDDSEAIIQRVVNYDDISLPAEFRARWKTQTSTTAVTVVGADAAGSDRVTNYTDGNPAHEIGYQTGKASVYTSTQSVLLGGITDYRNFTMTWETDEANFYVEPLDHANKINYLVKTHTTNVPAIDLLLKVTNTDSSEWLAIDWIFARPWSNPMPLVSPSAIGEEYTDCTPDIETNAATLVEETTATLNGNITNACAANVDLEGFVWDTSTHSSPGNGTAPADSDYTSYWTEDGDYGIGTFSHGITALTHGELYYFRACGNSTDSGHWGYGNESTFLTKPTEPNTFAAVDGIGESIDLTWVKGTGALNTEIWGKNGSYPATRGDGSLTYNSTGTSTTDSTPSHGEQWCYRAWSYVTEGGLFQYSDNYDEACATVNVSTTPIDQTAIGELYVDGTVAGIFEDTQSNDGTYEAITERVSLGKPSSSYSYLEHIWIFDVQPTNAVIFNGNVWAPSSKDCDNFVFAYSTDNSTWVNMFTVTATGDDDIYETFVLPASTSGIVYVRVMDTYRSEGFRKLDTVYVDHLFIRTEEVSVNLPAAPTDLVAIPISASQINLTWTDTADNENGFAIERSPNGLTDWVLLDTVVPDATSYSDTSLEGSTTYYYQVRAYNESGHSDPSNVANATTEQGIPMHIGDLDGVSILIDESRWYAVVTITVHDQDETAVSGATVSGSWSSGATGSGSVITDELGQCSFTMTILEGTVSSVTFTVDDVTLTGYTYMPNDNHDPDGDSDGTTIIVNQP